MLLGVEGFVVGVGVGKGVVVLLLLVVLRERVVVEGEVIRLGREVVIVLVVAGHLG